MAIIIINDAGGLLLLFYHLYEQFIVEVPSR